MLETLLRIMPVVLAAAIAPVFAAENEGDVPAPPQRENKIRVLIVTGGHEFDEAEFYDMFSGHPDIEWKKVEQPAAQKWFSAEKADEYDVMVWYDMYQNISDKSKRDLVALFDAGKPLLALHHSVANYQEWPESLQILGGRYPLGEIKDRPAATFKHDVQVPVHIVNPQHPITKFMSDFTIHDETYKNMILVEGTTPLLTTDEPTSDKLIGWTHRYRNAQVVYLQGGHDRHAYANPNYARLVIQSIRWLAGRLPESTDAGFKPLFNGKNLDGWKILGDPAGFKVVDGVIHSDLPYKGEWMRTEKRYADFILRVEWRVAENGNSGVFVRAADKDPDNVEGTYPWNTGSEIQISNFPRDIAHCTGSLYGTVSVDPRPDESPDTWHQFVIRCRGPHYTVFADNIPVVDIDSRKVPALSMKPWLGYIGLQDNHAEKGYIEYRNIEIKELKMVDGDPTRWRLGTQTYTFRLFTLFEAIDKAKALGLKYVECFPGQALSPDQKDVSFGHWAAPEVLDQVKRKLAENDIAVQCYGVVVPKDEAEWRQIFEFCRLMGIETITAEPRQAEEFKLLDKLTQEYDIKLAVHNHPKRENDPNYIYWSPDKVLERIEGCNPLVGVCADTGHWARSGLDPVECVKKLRGRIISFHLKDLNKSAPDAHDVHWGEGVCNIKGVLAELKKQNFTGAFSIEYEHNWENNMPDLAECIKYFRSAAKDLGY